LHHSGTSALACVLLSPGRIETRVHGQRAAAVSVLGPYGTRRRRPPLQNPTADDVMGLQLPCSFVLPLAWQRAAGTGPSSDQSRQRAAQLYPQSASQLIRKRDGGRADAILIARHGLRLMHQPRGDCRRMTTAASPPSMLPNPQPASEPVYVVRR